MYCYFYDYVLVLLFKTLKRNSLIPEENEHKIIVIFEILQTKCCTIALQFFYFSGWRVGLTLWEFGSIFISVKKRLFGFCKSGTIQSNKKISWKILLLEPEFLQ